ncbi:hypothetical protein THASP1DRAFT_27351 [Thamnocephalis sphaerospora]|uniref:BZIP domain-containing protein n=1 Tax=Thamnocephalis sphaerospora TaxID=78915 RepID=A0A4P9XWZ8_9FUNG|nr:hypothetical protein THASP1DRAFT_27351 [Thamnocephalis sphaerospora]|eukprot:RKP10866.1 hypothetical protein THASP1DRAFT_27351 [Thamnocephalis sphaerospora]
MNNEQLLAAITNSAAAVAAANIPPMMVTSEAGQQEQPTNGAQAPVEMWMQELQNVLFSPTAATPLFDSFTSPNMPAGAYNDLMDTPLFSDMDDFMLPTDSASEQLFPTSQQQPMRNLGQAASAAVAMLGTGAANSSLFPELNESAAASDTNHAARRVSASGCSLSVPWGNGAAADADADNAEPATFAGTTVRAQSDGSVTVTTKRGTTTITASQAAELLANNKRRRPTTSASGLPRPGPPLGAGGVRLVASTAPSPATPMVDTMPGMDPAALKRMKNTDAARRSRLRKVLKMESLERQVREVMTDNSELRTRLAVLENEKSTWIAKENEMREQIRALERRLDDAHRLLRDNVSRRDDDE